MSPSLNEQKMDRRNLLKASVAGAAVALTATHLSAENSVATSVESTADATPDQSIDLQQAAKQVRYCLNTSTIRGQKLGIVKEIELAAEAGYDGIEPWMREIQEYTDAGGKLADLKKQIDDAGLKVESAIGFANWIVDDDAARKQGLDSARRDMDVLRQLGGTRIAAPPVGATKEQMTDLHKIAERYRELLKVGAEAGVVPQLEVWGFSKTLSRLGETAFVAVEAAHPDACILPDIYHIYKGGSDFTGLKMLDGKSIHCFHINDYPADPPRDTINDADRVYPGDGVAPVSEILQIVLRNGFVGALSLELFNKDYWSQDAAVVVKTGLEKMRASVAAAVAKANG